MTIDLSTVNWLYVAIMAGFVFVAALLGGLISFRNRFAGACLPRFCSAPPYVAWNYYPHDRSGRRDPSLTTSPNIRRRRFVVRSS